MTVKWPIQEMNKARKRLLKEKEKGKTVVKSESKSKKEQNKKLLNLGL